MPSNFPAGYDDFNNPVATDPLDDPDVAHATQHSDINDAVEAMQQVMGLNPQGSFATILDRANSLEAAGNAVQADRDAAAASAAAALASENAAALSEGNAATSASDASTSESNASASAAAALASENAAADLLDQFDDRFLGAKASDPTLDNDGDPLIPGALYFNTGSATMLVYTGSSWINAADAVNFSAPLTLSGTEGGSILTVVQNGAGAIASFDDNSGTIAEVQNDGTIVTAGDVVFGPGATSLTAALAAPVPQGITDLTDVDTAGVADGDSLMFNSTSGEWEPGTLATATIDHSYTASDGQTVFTGADNNAVTMTGLSAPSAVVDVFMNGIMLAPTADYTFTDTTVTLTAGATVNDELTVRLFEPIQMTNGRMVTSNSVTSIEKMTQAAYDAITPDPNTLYVIEG